MSEPMEDLISRQAAIDALDCINGVEEVLRSLPSAQPDRSLWFRIGEVCVGESKGDISAEMAVEKIRELLREAERRKE